MTFARHRLLPTAAFALAAAGLVPLAPSAAADPKPAGVGAQVLKAPPAATAPAPAVPPLVPAAAPSPAPGPAAPVATPSGAPATGGTVLTFGGPAGGAAPAPAAPSPAAAVSGASSPAGNEPALSDAERTERDCATIEQSFSRLGGPLSVKAERPVARDVPVLQVLADLQRNMILLHQSRGCDSARLVEIMRGDSVTISASGSLPEVAVATPPAVRQPPQSSPPEPKTTPRPASITPAERPDAPVRLDPVAQPLVAKKAVTVRAAPKPGAQALGTIQGGGVLPITGRVHNSRWYQVDLGNGLIGYVFGDLLEPRDGPRTGATTARASSGRSTASALPSSPEELALRIEDLKRRAEAGDREAQFQLGNYHISQNDPFNAVGWWQAAAERGHPGAEYNMGVAYLTGKAVPQDQAKGVEWMRKAAAQGHERAKEALSKLGGG